MTKYIEEHPYSNVKDPAELSPRLMIIFKSMVKTTDSTPVLEHTTQVTEFICYVTCRELHTPYYPLFIYLMHELEQVRLAVLNDFNLNNTTLQHALTTIEDINTDRPYMQELISKFIIYINYQLSKTSKTVRESKDMLKRDTQNSLNIRTAYDIIA